VTSRGPTTELALQALGISESRYRRLFETARDGILLLNADSGQIEDVNPYLIEMLGYSHAEFLGKKLWEVGTFADVPQSKEMFHELQSKGYSRHADLPLRTKAGRRVQVEFVSNSYDCEGIKVIQCNIRDITERKLAEQELRRFRLAMDISGDGIVLVDRASMRYIDVNQTLCDMVGRTRQEVLGMTPMDLFSASQADLECAYDAIIADNNSAASKVEGQYRHRDGSLIPIETRRRALHTDDGWIIVGTARDITERKQNERELRESERRFSGLLGGVELASVMLDRDARITYCNDYLLRLTGWRREEVIGRNWFEAFMPAELGDMRLVFAQLLENLPEAWHREHEIYTRSCERRLIRWNNSVLRSGTGKVIGTASIGEDITEQKRAEVKIARLNRVYAVLSGINALIVRVHDRDELFREACRIAVEEGGFRMALVGIVDRSAMTIVTTASAGTDAEFLDEVGGRTPFQDDAPFGYGPPAISVREKRAIVVNDVENDPRIGYRKAHLDRGIRSLAILPLLIDGQPVAVLGLHSAEAGYFDEKEMKLLTELAGNVAFAIDHIQKAGKLERVTRVNAMLSGLNNAIVRMRGRDELFTEACRIAVSAGGFTVARVVEAELDGTVRIAASSEADPSLFQRIVDEYNSNPALSPSLLAVALRSRKPVISNDVANDPRVPNRIALTAQGTYALALLPIIVDERVAGIVVLRAREAGMFDDAELNLLLELVSNLSFALELMEQREKLDYLAYYDSLTGLANRHLFLERVGQYMRSAATGGHRLAVFLVDLERFKNINDSLGRPAGDTLLKQVADWLSRNAGDTNLLGRIGADHFALVLPVVKPGAGVTGLLEKTIAAFMEHPFRLDDAVFRIAVKVGVAMCPGDGADADTLFRNAEAALKKAKARGERYLFYKQKMTEAVAGKLNLENQLRQALDRNEFVLHYQPKVNLDSGKITGAEALIRWNDPRTGLVPPGRFIPILEETGLINEVGRWALRQAIADYLRWRNAGLAAVRIAVNVSPLQLRNRGFVAEIQQATTIDAKAAAGLELEITESLIMEDVKHSIATLRAIRAMGVSIAIDDFGTGFSSLSQLTRLPVDTLKIDRSFVIDMTGGPEGLALVSTIINLAHSLKLKVVAEGVETDEQARLLRLLGCDDMQGFLYSKPVPAGLFEDKFLAPASSAAG
jgi:diguanylate cyclase (GGDEF)-like protein/PAS domain S-box-containing protein